MRQTNYGYVFTDGNGQYLKDVPALKSLFVMFLLLLISLPAVSDTFTEKNESCQGLAEAVELFATFRDQGMPKSAVMDAANTVLKEKNYPDGMVKTAVELAFSYPKRSPQDEGNNAYYACMEAKW